MADIFDKQAFVREEQVTSSQDVAEDVSQFWNFVKKAITEAFGNVGEHDELTVGLKISECFDHR
jgi:hypothetical protein